MSLHLKGIDIVRARGIQAGDALRVSDLAPRLNIISGPNGSGKSTMALAIRQTIWPASGDLPGAFLVADWDHDGEPIQVKIDGGHLVGTSGMPEVGPAERRRRYLLALHELVAAESDSEAEFVERLVKAAMGEFDVTAAERALSWSKDPSRRRKLESDVQAAEAAVRKAVEQQRELAQDEARVEALSSKLAEALKAQRRLAAIKQARLVQSRLQSVAEEEYRLAQFPDAVGKMHGSEREELAAIRDRIQELEREQTVLEKEVGDARDNLLVAGFPGQPPSAVDLETWKQDVRELQDVVRSREGAAAKAAEARNVLSAAWQRLVDDELLPADVVLEKVDAEAWSELWKDWAVLEAQDKALEQQQRTLESVIPETVSDTRPDEAIRLLARWMRAADVDANATGDRAVRVALVFLVIATGLLAALVHPGYVSGLIIPAAIWFWHMRLGNGRRVASPGGTGPTTTRVDIAAEWQRDAPGPAPDAWSEDAVAAHLDRFVKEKALRAMAEAARSRLQGLDLPRTHWRKERTALENRLERLEAASGIRVGDRMQGAAWLGVAIQRVQVVERARADMLRAEGTLEELGTRFNDILARLGRSVGEHVDARFETVQAAIAAVERVTDRATAWQKASARLQTAQSSLSDRVVPALEKQRQQQTDVLARMGLAMDSVHKVDERVSEHVTYRSVQEALSNARALANEAHTSLRALAAEADEHAEDLVARSAADLEALEIDVKELADRATSLLEERTTIRTNVDAARSRQDMTEALERRDDLRGQLDEHRHESMQQIAGRAVAEWVRAQAMKRSMPAVFSRARELLARFTAGAMELDVDMTEDVPRIVVRTATGTARAPGHLSVGERVQVLMAVRVAFLEHEEVVALPLMVDEALGTSDDMRAQAIIDALLQLAADGRQIFYFTAQSDEVLKWTERIAERGDLSEGDWKPVDLASVRNLESVRRTPLPAHTLSRPDVPAPEGRSHTEYGRLLGVPGLDPLMREPAGEHIWHVTDNVDRLHALLDAGITTIHAWQTLDAVHAPACGSDDERAAVRARIRLLVDATGLWRIGRGQPVDRSVLEASGAVTSNFIDPVADLSRRVGGEAGTIVEALENGEVSGFRKAKIADLKEWLLDNKYLDDTAPLEPDDARIRLMSRHGDVPSSAIDRILQTLWTTD